MVSEMVFRNSFVPWNPMEALHMGSRDMAGKLLDFGNFLEWFYF